MNKIQIKGRWIEIKSKIKMVFTEVTEEDLIYDNGKEEELLDRLQKKTGKRRVEIVKWLNGL